MANRTHFFNKLPHMPNGTHASGRPPYAEREGVNRLNIVLPPERAFHAGSMPCSHNGLLFVSHISCWRRKRRPFKSRSSTHQKKPASKGSWFPPFENGSAAEAEFAPRRRLLKKKKPTSLEAGFSDSEWCPRRESNSHVFRQRFLRPPRLPFRHSGAKSNYTRCSRKRKPKFQSTRKKQRYRPKIVRTGTKAEPRRLRFEDAEARRSFGSKASKKMPFGSWDRCDAVFAANQTAPELASLRF